MVAGLAVTGSLLTSMMHSTGTTEFGLSVYKPTGEITADYQPGSTYFFPPIINDWYTLDSKLENLVMTREVNEGDRTGDDSIRFKTKDGNDVSISMVVGYRIDPKKIDYIIQYVAQSNEEIKDKIVRPIVRSALRDSYGILGTDEFYDTTKRNAITDAAKNSLVAKLESYGLIVERVDYRGHWYENPDYQTALQDKKTAEANTLNLEDAILARVEENTTLLNNAQGQVNKDKADADGRFSQAKIIADAKLTKQINEANAIKKEADSIASGIRAEAKAMLSGGGETLVQMELIKALQGKPITMVPTNEGGSGIGLQTLDINRFLEVQGIRKTIENPQ